MMADKHPLYWKVKAHLHAFGEAHARSLITAQLAGQADRELTKAFQEAGLDRTLIPSYEFNDEDETISIAVQSGTNG